MILNFKFELMGWLLSSERPGAGRWLENLTSATRLLLSGVPDYFDRNKISSGGDLSHYSSASLY